MTSSDTGPLHATYSLNEDDVLSGARLATRMNAAVMVLVYFFLLVWVAIGVALLVGSIRGKNGFDGISDFFIWALGLVVWYWMLWGAPRTMRKQFRHIPGARDEVDLYANDDGVRLRQEHASRYLHWVHVRRWRENDRVFLLLYAKYERYVIPKSALSPEGAAKLREILRSHVGAAA